MISQEAIDNINALVIDHGLDESAITSLRTLWPEIHFTYCSDDDVTTAKPILESQGFNIYLVDGRDHCLQFTTDLDVATGLVLAEVEEDMDE